MGLLKNKKGVEGLPFKYIIIALVAALVIGIALQFTNILGEGTISSAERISESLENKTICELDEDPPVITEFFCNETSGVMEFKLTDECGVNPGTVKAFVFEDDERLANLEFELKTEEHNTNDGVWSISNSEEIWNDSASGYYNITIWADDASTSENHLSTTYRDQSCE